MARKERLVHSKLYPGWSARENYVSAAASLSPLLRFLRWLIRCVVFLFRVKRRRERGPRVRVMKVHVSSIARFLKTKETFLFMLMSFLLFLSQFLKRAFPHRWRDLRSHLRRSPTHRLPTHSPAPTWHSHTQSHTWRTPSCPRPAPPLRWTLRRRPPRRWPHRPLRLQHTLSTHTPRTAPTCPLTASSCSRSPSPRNLTEPPTPPTRTLAPQDPPRRRRPQTRPPPHLSWLPPGVHPLLIYLLLFLPFSLSPFLPHLLPPLRRRRRAPTVPWLSHSSSPPEEPISCEEGFLLHRSKYKKQNNEIDVICTYFWCCKWWAFFFTFLKIDYHTLYSLKTNDLVNIWL